MNESVDAIVSALSALDRRPGHSALLIAIDGRGGAGKSTLARRVQQALQDVTVIHKDDFYRVMDEEVRFHLDALEGYRRYFDWERLLAQVLEPLKRGNNTAYQRYDWLVNGLTDWIPVQSKGVVIVEGIYSLRPELRDYYDFKIYVETPEAECLRRQIARQENAEEWIGRWAAAEALYMERYRPQERANLSVRGI